MGTAISAVSAKSRVVSSSTPATVNRFHCCDYRFTPAQLTLAQLLHQGDDIVRILVLAIPSASTAMSPPLTSG
jgi:hypothetical protein